MRRCALYFIKCYENILILVREQDRAPSFRASPVSRLTHPVYEKARLIEEADVTTVHLGVQHQ